MTKRVALYLRVSTDEQTLENQRRELEAVAARNGWDVVATFEANGISGAKGRAGRPGFDALCKAVTLRQIDLVMAWSVCRLGRSLQHLVTFLGELQAKGVAVVGISANDVANYPQDSPEQMVHEAESRGYSFPYLYDDTQDVAKAYAAACTPDFYVFDRDQRLVYRGQMDSSRPDSGIPVTGEDLRAALDAVLSGSPVSEDQKPSLGCNIKWIEGSEPDYFGP